MEANRILIGDNRETLKSLPDACVQCCVTSPPYWGQRLYGGGEREIGQEETPQQYVETMVGLFQEVRRVLRDDGTLWLNLGDKFTSGGGEREYGSSDGFTGRASQPDRATVDTLAAKNLIGLPWRVALALQADGWILRCDCIWHKPNAMPGSQKDRPTVNHEYLFLFSKRGDYFYDDEAVKEIATHAGETRPFNSPKKVGRLLNGKTGSGNEHPDAPAWEIPSTRTRRSVWTIPVASEKDSHFAVFPHKLVEPCIMAGTSERGQCVKCGAPWERVVESERFATRPGKDTKVTGDSLVDGNRDPQRHEARTKTIGWQPTCKCGADETEPQIVLDIFGGSGTTAQVARHLGRRWIICELNEQYAEIAKRKIRRNPYASRSNSKPMKEQQTLFAEAD